MKLLVVLLAVLVTGCTCQLSGTPLDTMEKTLNPACWSCGDSAPPPAPADPPDDDSSR
jgi:hypothetical protein